MSSDREFPDRGERTTSTAPPPANSSNRRPQQRPPRPKTFQCDHCTRAFDRPSLRDQHILTHTGEQPHLCTKCNEKRFSRTSNLYRHMRTCKGGEAGSSASAAASIPPSSDSAPYNIRTSNEGTPSGVADEDRSHAANQTLYNDPQALGLGLGASRATSLSNNTSSGQNASASVTSSSTPASVSTSYPSSPSVSFDPEYLSDRVRSEDDGGGNGQSRPNVAPSASSAWGPHPNVPWRPPKRRNTEESAPSSPLESVLVAHRNAAESPEGHGNTYPGFVPTKNAISPPPSSAPLSPSGIVVSEDIRQRPHHRPRRAQQGQAPVPPNTGPSSSVAQHVHINDYTRRMAPSMPSVSVLSLPMPPSSSVWSIAPTITPTVAGGSTPTTQYSPPRSTAATESPPTSKMNSNSNLPTSSSVRASNSLQAAVPSTHRRHQPPAPQPSGSRSGRGLESGGRGHAQSLVPVIQQHDRAQQNQEKEESVNNKLDPWLPPHPNAQPSSSPSTSHMTEQQHYERDEWLNEQSQFGGSLEQDGEQDLQRWQRNRQRGDQSTSISIPQAMMQHHSFPQYATYRPHQLQPGDQQGSSAPATSASTSGWGSEGVYTGAYLPAHHYPSYPPPHHYQDPQVNYMGTGVEHGHYHGNFRRAPDHEPATGLGSATTVAASVQNDQGNDGFQPMYPSHQHYYASPASIDPRPHESHETTDRQGHKHGYTVLQVADAMDGGAGVAAAADRIDAAHLAFGGELVSPNSFFSADSHLGDGTSRWESRIPPHQNYPIMPTYGDQRQQQQPQGQEHPYFWPSSGGNPADLGPNTHAANLPQDTHIAYTFDYGQHSLAKSQNP